MRCSVVPRRTRLSNRSRSSGDNVMIRDVGIRRERRDGSRTAKEVVMPQLQSRFSNRVKISDRRH
jgi:hypothetical protein